MNSNCCTHSVGPEAVDPSVFKSSCQGNPRIHLAIKDLLGRDNFKVTHWIDTNRDKHSPQTHLNPWSCCDSTAANRGDISPFDHEV